MAQRVPYERMLRLLARCLMDRRFSPDRALRCAALFAENSLVGIASHGLNRFPRFLEWIDNGWINPGGIATRVSSHGNLERWDGHLGPGPLLAEQCMQRAIDLASPDSLGCVALRESNHWMRAGSYAWQAADAGLIGLCFTNTEPNVPPWGSVEPKLGNNPFAAAIPRSDGCHILYDGAISQFSYGALETAAQQGKRLPVPGGIANTGEMTDDPAEILASKRALPIGFWKGSGLSLILDLLATILTAGRSTCDLGSQNAEYGVSQVFIAVGARLIDRTASEAIERTLIDLHTARTEDTSSVRYPGEQLYARRIENLRLGIPVDPAAWDDVKRLACE